MDREEREGRRETGREDLHHHEGREEDLRGREEDLRDEDELRACYGPTPRTAVAWCRNRQANATKCNPAKVSGSLS
jgi:hypothetical protein